MNNTDLFGVFASQILANLYERFPVSTQLPKSEMTAIVAAQSTLQGAQGQLSTVEGMEELLKAADLMTPELASKAKAKREKLEAEVASESGRGKAIEAVYEGTVSFLSAEGYIREVKGGEYQLTAKGLVHLNQPFEKSSNTIFQKLQEALRPEKFVGSLTSGTLVSIVAKIIGA
ncbi:MAG: hypothetical protein Q8N44_18160 [Rubrivivax sp.]|nr:hypothetical protein [Rubrivivax sp.]